MCRSLRLLAVLAILSLSSAVFAEQVDNPAYLNWAKYKPGSSLTLKQSQTMAMMQGMTTETTITQKLVDVKPDKITVEQTMKVSMTGMPGMPAGAGGTERTTTTTIPAKVEKGQEYAPTEAAGMKIEIKDMKEGKETVDVKGAKVDTITHEYTAIMTQTPTTGPADPSAAFMAGGMTMKIKAWTSDTVPGGTVKVDQTGTMGQMGEIKVNITLVDFTIVK